MGKESIYRIITVIIATWLYAGSTYAQNQPRPQDILPQFRPPHPAAKMEQRFFIIDAKRISATRPSEGLDGDDALPRSREFKRIDSTYYVGWMFEGAYKYNHAADYLGFKNAIQPLEKALYLMERDYAKALATRTGDIMTYYPIRQFGPDYTNIAYYLMQCYSNTEQPDKVFSLLQRLKRWNFQTHYYMDAYTYMAWTVHRNRFYTKDKYGFLRNSIDENEKLANAYLDTAMRKITLNSALNEQLGATGMAARERQSVYHYKNILYSYSFQIDSAEHYFDLMRQAGRLPHNNYATFKAVCGDFRTAEKEYEIAAQNDGYDKRLQEWAYYSSIINLYKGKPKMAAELARSMIKSAGSTPGYGWYNIALARALLYDGQISEAQKYADRAQEFKEVHIGTTLGQSHYEFSIQLIKLINKNNERAMQQFEHRNWWYNPAVLAAMSGKLSEQYLQQFLIINQFAQNPERDRVIYKLFSNESTISWDEIWYLIQDFSTKFFITRFEKEVATDKRPRIHKYFELMTAKLKMKQGNYKEAKKTLDALLRRPDVDAEYEQLYIARLYEAEAICAKELKRREESADWMNKFYSVYPQLVPYSGLTMNMNLHVMGDVDKEVVERLKDCNINWVNDPAAPSAYITFARKVDKKNITYYVIDNKGQYIVNKQTFAWKKAGETGVALAYRLFNIGGTASAATK